MRLMVTSRIRISGAIHRGRAAISVNAFLGSKKTPEIRENSPIPAGRGSMDNAVSGCILGELYSRTKAKAPIVRYRRPSGSSMKHPCLTDTLRISGCISLRFILVSVPVLALFTLAGCQKQAPQQAAAAPPVTPVSAVKVVQQAVPTELRVVGSVEASAIVQIKSQVAGELTAVTFTEGQNVSKGDLLFRIDSRPYEEALLQAQAAVERDKAQIAQADATLARDTAQAKYAETDA